MREMKASCMSVSPTSEQFMPSNDFDRKMRISYIENPDSIRRQEEYAVVIFKSS